MFLTGRKKRLGNHKERRFTTLGFEAGAIVYHHDDFVKLVESTVRNNELVRAIKTYLTVPELLDFLKSLSICTETVCLPFLKLSERLPHDELLKAMKALYEDLSNGSLNTLDGYCDGFSFGLTITSTRVQNLCNLMAVKMGECLSTQRGREYGFGKKAEKERATSMTVLPSSFISHLPTNNLACERDLAIMDRKYRRSGFTQTGDTNSRCKYNISFYDVSHYFFIFFL